MIGDHRNDVQAALGAGLPCIFAAWGYGAPAMAAGAAGIAASPEGMRPYLVDVEIRAKGRTLYTTPSLN
jgi:phosphoglycolate phosphatase